MPSPVDERNPFYGYKGDAADLEAAEEALKDMNLAMSCGVPVQVKEALDKSGWTRFKQGACAYGGKGSMCTVGLGPIILTVIGCIVGSGIQYVRGEDKKAPWKWLWNNLTELWDKTNEYKKGMKEGVKVERAVRTAAPWMETTVRNHPDSNLKPIRPYTPEAIKARFENGNDNVEFDNDTSNHYIIDTANGVVLLKINEGEEVKYKAIYIFDPAKKNGNHVKDPNTLRKMARTMLANHQDSKSGSALQKYDVLVFHISNLGGAKHLDIRGFNYENWQKGADGSWYWNPEGGPFEKVDLTSTRYGEEVKYEEDLKKALCRIFKMDDKPSLQDGNKGSRAEGAGKTGAKAKLPDAPPGFHLLPAEGDGECGFRSLKMGKSITEGNRNEEEVQRLYNKKDKEGLEAMVAVRGQIAAAMTTEWQKRAKGDVGGRTGFIHQIRDTIQEEINRASAENRNSEPFQDIKDATITRHDELQAKKEVTPEWEYENIAAPFLQLLTQNYNKGGLQMNNFIVRYAAEALGHPVQVWSRDANGEWQRPDHDLFGIEFDRSKAPTIHVRFTGNHYDLLVPNKGHGSDL